MSLVWLNHINKIYQTEGGLPYQALKDVNLKIEKGDFAAIIGPSGSGKSTLMNIMGLLDSPTSGTYKIDSVDVSGMSENRSAEIRNKKIGFVFQSFNLLPRTSALENVALPLVYSGVSEQQRLARARGALSQVGLSEKTSSTPNQLSGGQQQRVAIARALVTNPEIILADEPTGNLDTKTSIEIMDLFKSLNLEGRTIVLITHEPSIARRTKRTIHVKDGRVWGV